MGDRDNLSRMFAFTSIAIGLLIYLAIISSILSYIRSINDGFLIAILVIIVWISALIVVVIIVVIFE